jgi:hypothetical protein
LLIDNFHIVVDYRDDKMGIIEKIKEIEAEMARTQKNKATG